MTKASIYNLIFLIGIHRAFLSLQIDNSKNFVYGNPPSLRGMSVTYNSTRHYNNTSYIARFMKKGKEEKQDNKNNKNREKNKEEKAKENKEVELTPSPTPDTSSAPMPMPSYYGMRPTPKPQYVSTAAPIKDLTRNPTSIPFPSNENSNDSKSVGNMLDAYDEPFVDYFINQKDLESEEDAGAEGSTDLSFVNYYGYYYGWWW